MIVADQDNTARVRQLNDALRTTGTGGSVMVTAGVAALPAAEREAALVAVRGFTANDPCGEHDCASLQVGDHGIIWKIDYYDLHLAAHSTDPADPSQTRRVLTIMLSSDY